MLRVALTIAGSDPSGGAGIQADLKTFHQFQTYGMSVITLITVQNTKTVEQVKILDPDLVTAQLKCVIDDIQPHAVKTGALGNAEVADALSSKFEKFNFPLVVDPVLVSKHGKLLLDSDGEFVLRKQIIPQAYLVTPNLEEASRLSERDVTDLKSMEQAAITISKLGARNVLIKGGHLIDDATDILYHEKQIIKLPSQRIETRNTHGTGCTYSAAITAMLAKNHKLIDAVQIAKKYVTEAIRQNPELGSGQGPVNHLVRV